MTALSLTDLAALAPLLVLLAGALGVLLLESFNEDASKKYSAKIAFATFIAAALAAYYAPNSTNALLTPWIKFDSLTRFLNILFLAVGGLCTLLAVPFFKRFEASHGEYFFLLLSATFGLLLIGQAADFLTFFLGIETLSISLYVMCGYMKKWELSHEASIKYLFTGAIATAFLLYGIALIYGAVGTTRFDALLPGYQAIATTQAQTLFLAGIALVTAGLCFKAAVFPFQFWAPDVYDGAPTPVTAFMAVGTKAGVFAAFIRIFLEALPQFNPLFSEILSWIAIPTLIYANFVAIRQTQLRRFFAYSGIAHAGYLLIPVIAGGPEAIPALLYYLVVYTFATLGCFAVLALLESNSIGVTLHDLQGLFKRQPFLAGVMAICLLTLAGIPPTAGFFAKFYLFKVAFEGGYYALVVVALLTTILSAYYYLRMITVMLSPKSEEAVQPIPSRSGVLVAFFAAAAIVCISLYPTPLLALIETAKTVIATTPTM